MTLGHRTLSLLLLAVPARAAEEPAVGLRVRRVELRGLRFTRAESLMAFIDTREGAAFDPEALRADVERVRNLELFESVSARAEERDAEVDVTFDLVDKWALLPYVDFFRGGGSAQIVVGVFDANFAGRIWEVGAEYRHFDGEPAGFFYTTVPRPLGTRLVLAVSALVETTGRTAYEGDGEPAYDYLVGRRQAAASVEYALMDWLRPAIRYRFARDAFGFAATSPARDVLPPDGDTSSLGARVVFGVVRFHEDYRLDGTDLVLAADIAREGLGSDFDVLSTEARARAFLRLGRRHNLGVAVKAARATGDVHFQHEYVLGSLTTSRGFLAEQFRGRRYLAGSIEYRANLARAPAPLGDRLFHIFRGRPLQFQGVAFVDLGVYGGSPDYALDHAGDLLGSFGLGVRLIARPLYRAILRVDLARTFAPLHATDIVVGTQQFF